jgi:hypothetical protein
MRQLFIAIPGTNKERRSIGTDRPLLEGNVPHAFPDIYKSAPVGLSPEKQKNTLDDVSALCSGCCQVSVPY